MTDTYPSFRLKPKMNAQKIRHGFPWVYENEVVTDRRTRALAPGTVAVLLDSDQNPLGLFAANPNSKIFGRALDGDISTTLDVEWFEHKLQTALSLRQRLFDQPYYRLIHAEADGLPGLIIDRFGDVLVVQPNAAWIDRLLPTLSTALQNVLNPTAIMMNGTGRSRALEGLSDERNVIYGALPDQPLPVPMNNATYFADLAEGQKTGLFFDQRPNHAFVQQFAKDARVLDVFCHVGGFGLAAMANGAAHTCFVDGSQAALDLAKMGANATAPNASTQFMKSDAFIALDAMH
ncbi:MAG: class I SAM-dependent rRNA methyltransferase, partial [Planktomarina sp.]